MCKPARELYPILCFVLLITVIPPVQLSNCTRALDVVFVLDSSPDTSDNWNLMIKLTKDVASQLRPSEFGTHVAVVRFANYAYIVHGLERQLMTNTSIAEPGFETGRNLADAIYKTRRLVLDNTKGDRPEVPDVLVIMSHGPSGDKNATLSAATEVKSEGIRIIAIGIADTQVVDLRQELSQIVTDPEERLMLINPIDYIHLHVLVSSIVEVICRSEAEAYQCDNGSLSLVDGTSIAGRLEVCLNEEWVTVCSKNWNHANTKIACKELGFPDGQIMYSMNSTSHFRRVGVDNIQCIGNESYLLECAHNSQFLIDSSCDHRQDVFLQCLCNDCDDYSPRDNVRWSDSTSTSGLLEILSPGLGWRGVCDNGWIGENTRVGCRQLGFSDGAGTIKNVSAPSVTIMPFHIRCSGNETSVVQCNYSSVSHEDCSHPVYIQCECKKCRQFIIKAPQLNEVTTGSTVEMYWNLSTEVGSVMFQFLSQKNPQTFLRVVEGKCVKEHTRFRDRVRLINPDNQTIGFTLTNTTAADMGIYALTVPQLLFNSQAVLIVKDFAIVPDPVLNRAPNSSVQFSWDLTALRRIGEISYALILTTPATGRVSIDYYYTNWLTNNPDRHEIPENVDYLHPTIVVRELSAKDAGIYAVDVSIASPFRKWIKADWQFSTELRVTDIVALVHPSTYRHGGFLVTTIVLSAVLLILCTTCASVRLCAGINHMRRKTASANNSRDRRGTVSDVVNGDDRKDGYYTLCEIFPTDEPTERDGQTQNAQDCDDVHHSSSSSPRLPPPRSGPGCERVADVSTETTVSSNSPLHIKTGQHEIGESQSDITDGNRNAMVSQELQHYTQRDDEISISPRQSQPIIKPQSQNDYGDRIAHSSVSEETSVKKNGDTDNTYPKQREASISTSIETAHADETEIKYVPSKTVSEMPKESDADCYSHVYW